jgi:hypothetical protein
MEANANENTTNQNHWKTAKVFLRGKFTAMSTDI